MTPDEISQAFPTPQASAVENPVVGPVPASIPPVEQPQTAETPPPPKSKKKLFLIVGIVVLLLVLVAVGVFAFMKLNTPKMLEDENLPTPMPTWEVIDEMDNWETYVDDKFNYSLKYPSGYKFGVILENEAGRMVGFMKEASADDPSIAKVEVSSSNKSLAEQYEDLSRNQTFEETNLGQYKAYKTIFTSPFRATAYLVGNDTASHLILTTVLSGGEKTFEEIFQKILSTFEFIDPFETSVEWDEFNN